MRQRKRVLIWATGLDDFFLRSKEFNGGIVVQLSLWARALLAHGWEVYSLSEHRDATVEGVQFLRSKPHRGLQRGIIDSVAPLIVLARLRPGAIIFRGASRNLFFVSIWAKLLGVRVVFMGASNTDFLPGKELVNRGYDRRLYGIGLKVVDRIVVQNQTQRDLLCEFYGRKEVLLIPNIWNCGSQRQMDIGYPNGPVLWVSNFRPLKRPVMFLELAARLPAAKFLMIGGPGDPALFDRSKVVASGLHNVAFLGALPFEEADAYFRKTSLLVCTSEAEGFPNTFLQAWANGVPVVSTFDPGGVIKANGLGLIVSDLDSLAIAVRMLLDDKDQYLELQSNIRGYFESAHSADLAIGRLTEFALT